MSGVLISISGTDGSGKSTQSRLLVQSLENRGYQAVYFWTRGGHTPLLDVIRKLFRYEKKEKNEEPEPLYATPQSEVSTRATVKKRKWKSIMKERVYMAISLIDLARIYGLQMRWLMRRHDVIVCDRYLLDTLVDFSVRFPGNQVEKWWLWQLVVWLSPVPDRSFFLRTSVETSNKRLIANNDPASEYPINLAQRLQYYDVLAEQKQWIVLSGEDAVNAIEERILTDVLSTLEQK